MNKRTILVLGIISAAVVVSGTATAIALAMAPGGTAPSSSTQEVSSVSSKATTTDDIAAATSSALTAIDSAKNEAVSAVKQAASQTAHTQTDKDAEAQTSSAIPEPKTIALDVTSEGKNFSLHFTSVKINYEYGAIEFSYDVMPSSAHPSPNSAETYCVDNAGNRLTCGLLGTTGPTTNAMAFYKFSDPSDLSTVTVTYCFKNEDPITVTINIPGL